MQQKHQFIQKNLLLFFQIVLLMLPGVSQQAIASSEMHIATELLSSLHQRGKPYLDCAFKLMDRPYRITSVPWARAQLGTQKGAYDGFFMASKNAKRDLYAVHSDAFFNIEWLYVVKKGSGISPDDNDFSNKLFAANKGSARLTWLQDKFNKEQVINTTNSMNSINMLNKGRVDVNLENDENLKTALKDLQLKPENFDTFLAKSKPVGLYVSKALLQREPDFLKIFNSNLKLCQ